MKKFLIVTLAILFGMGMMTGSASADSYDPTYDGAGYPYGTPPLPQIGGMLWNHGNVGDALLGPVYRAVEDDSANPFSFVSYMCIENLSRNWVAAHIRLRAGRYSIEVRDFPILLSPRDVFWFQFQVVPDAVGGIAAVQIVSRDAGTLASSGIPSPMVLNLDAALLNQFNRLYPDGAPLEELTQGYIEVFGLFECVSNLGLPLPNIMNQLWSLRNFGGLAAFTANGLTWQFPRDVKKSLAGHVFLGDFRNGLYMGYPMNAIKDFRTNVTNLSFPNRIQPLHRDIDALKAFPNLAILPLRTAALAAPAGVPLPNLAGDLGGQNAVGGWYEAGCILYNMRGIASNDMAYSDPDWATSFGPTWNDGDDLTGFGIWPHDSWSLDEVDDALVKQRVQSTYFNGGFDGAQTYTLLSLTFPTKYLHLFYDAPSGLVDPDTLAPLGSVADAAVGSNRFGWPVGINPGGQRVIRAQMDLVKYTGVMTARASAWDLAENRPGDFSPNTWLILPYEVNFLPIGDLSIPVLEPFCFLSVPQPDSPFGLLRNADGYFAGQLFLEGFSLSGALLQGDPRTLLFDVFGVGGYGRVALPLLNILQNAPYFDSFIIPVVGITMDWEFTNFSHARSIEVNFDNQVLGGPPLNDYPVF